MNEPILGKNKPHGYDYKPMTQEAMVTLIEAAQKTAKACGFPVYLVGSAVYSETPRDIDVSIIMPVDEYEKRYSKLPKNQDEYNKYLHNVSHISFEFTKYLYFCIDYHLDIKVCPDIWWTNKPKLILALPEDKETK